MAKKIILSGGFHNSSDTFVVVEYKDDVFADYKRGIIDKVDLIHAVLSGSQLKRLEKHFCGVEGCTCGSWTRADIEIKDVGMTTNEILRSIRECGGFDNWRHWNAKECAEWVYACYPCSKTVARNVGRFIQNGWDGLEND